MTQLYTILNSERKVIELPLGVCRELAEFEVMGKGTEKSYLLPNALGVNREVSAGTFLRLTAHLKG